LQVNGNQKAWFAMLPYTDEAAVGDIVKADSNGRLVFTFTVDQSYSDAHLHLSAIAVARVNPSQTVCHAYKILFWVELQ